MNAADARYQRALDRIHAWTSGPLDLSGLQLTSLPPIPPEVTELFCESNFLTSLALPAGLRVLNCNHNELTELGGGPFQPAFDS